MFKFNCSKYWQNLSLRFSQSTSFEEHYERKHEQFPSESPLYLTFNKSSTKMHSLSLIVASTGKRYQQDFDEVFVLKDSTNGAMSSSFRRAPCT